MIKSIFYARFHDKKGTNSTAGTSVLASVTVVHQVPEGSVTPAAPAPPPAPRYPPSPKSPLSPTASTSQRRGERSSPSFFPPPPPLLDFASIADYVLPRDEFCNRLLTVCSRGLRVIGYPVVIEDEAKYARKFFRFNFCVVVGEELEWGSCAGVVKKLGGLARGLEEMGGFLSREEEESEDEGEWEDEGRDEGWAARRERDRGKVYALCEMILEDLNNYCECMIPIDDANTINLKLFPPLPPPPRIRPWHVPLATVRLTSSPPVPSSPRRNLSAAGSTPTPSPLHVTDDLTLSRILPHINGVRSVAAIAALADTDLSLARKAVAHLAYYGCIVLLDIFQFAAVYAPTPEISALVESADALDECRRYVYVYGAEGLANVGAGPESAAGGVGSVEESSASSRLAVGSPTGVMGRSGGTTPKGLGGNGFAAHHALRGGRPQSPHSEFLRPNPFPSSVGTTAGSATPTALSNAGPTAVPAPPDNATLVALYTSLRQGQALRAWCLDHAAELRGVDVRRLITFGVIKGFLYRVHKYAVATGGGSGAKPSDQPVDGEVEVHDGASGLSNGLGVLGTVDGRAGVVRGGSGQTSAVHSRRGSGQEREREREREYERMKERERERERERDLPLARYLDGMHCFDEICTELGMSERDLSAKLRQFGDVLLIHR
ncbi:nitrogen permease regulator 2-domain-containing protein [Lineolata rhizophorae]|uniref:Nitrogen permease regulator 2-domain-containing protein n=1 Tax=Lineolata rhizophorae TaxID=578093 RepID=A0A6A6NP23_9PEZI|nr:nitrogen permease regulator 2-domain-containing protein [Lineolata rhizophorae]